MRGSLSLHLNKRMVKAFVCSVALYGSETWTLQKEDIRRLKAFEIWIWRRMMKVPWTEHKTNKEILLLLVCVSLTIIGQPRNSVFIRTV